MVNLLASDISILDGLIYALFGMVFVFVGIAILIGIISIMGAVMKKRSAPKKVVKNVPVKQAEPEKVEAVAQEEELSDEIKAAIVAAIMAFYENEKPYSGFTVKRIKRIN